MHQSKLLLQLETKNSRDLPATTLGWCSTSEVNIRTRSSNTSVPSNFTDNRTLSAERATLSATLAVFICCWENFVRRCPITGKHWRSANVLVSSLLPVMILATLRYALPVSEMSMPLSKTSTAPPRLREKQGWQKKKRTGTRGRVQPWLASGAMMSHYGSMQLQKQSMSAPDCSANLSKP